MKRLAKTKKTFNKKNVENTKHNLNNGFDILYDYELIESSMLHHYPQIKGRNELLKMPWREFISLLSNISETTFNDVIRIRTEKDQKRIKDYSSYERRVRNEWLQFVEDKNKQLLGKEEIDKRTKAANEDLKQMLINFCR